MSHFYTSTVDGFASYVLDLPLIPAVSGQRLVGEVARTLPPSNIFQASRNI
jgi:hypothetical protein